MLAAVKKRIEGRPQHRAGDLAVVGTCDPHFNALPASAREIRERSCWMTWWDAVLAIFFLLVLIICLMRVSDTDRGR